MHIKETLGRLNKDELLAAMGLETRKSVMDYLWPAASLLAVGVVVGAGLGLVFAPKSGRELRADIGKGAATLRSKLGGRALAVAGRSDGSNGGDRDLAFLDTDQGMSEREHASSPRIP